MTASAPAAPPQDWRWLCRRSWRILLVAFLLHVHSEVDALCVTALQLQSLWRSPTVAGHGLQLQSLWRIPTAGTAYSCNPCGECLPQL